MAPIQKRKREENVDPYAPVLALRFPIRPCSDWWDNFSQRFPASRGQNNSAEFGSFFKFSRKTFDYICGLVEDEMIKSSDLRGEVLSLNDRVAIALRRLSSGESLATVGNLVGVHPSAVGDITWSFVEAMEKKGSHHLHWPSTEEELTQIKSKFKSIRGLPNCCGAIDTTRFVFSSPCDDLSMALQAIVGVDMRFLSVSIKWGGCLSASHTLFESSFFRLYVEGKRLMGEKQVIQEGIELELREYIVGDGEFPLLPWLITPYQGRGVLSVIKEDFNKRHYQTWKVANEALTRLKETWKIMNGIVCEPNETRLTSIANVCCTLHNIMIDQNDAAMQAEISLPSHYSPESLQKKVNLSDEDASAQRDILAIYLAFNHASC